jgi:CubicO group peptidase (beta-lactamase class C family)
MHRCWIKMALCAAPFILALSFGIQPGLANTPEDAPGIALHQNIVPPGPADPAELESFFDGIITKQLENLHIPGAVVSVVKDGGLIFAKGYGYADWERRIPFQPETSLVRIGSVTKLFTWTSVMQLVEQGLLDLNADVNTYLTAFQVPDTYPEPVTLAHLMTHTAGFENAGIGSGASRKEDVPPLGEYLAGHMPARVRPPGGISAYSNYGGALAGYIVAEVSGLSFEQYVQENILDPLEMDRTTAREPVPDPLSADLAVSYQYRNGEYEPIPFIYEVGLPAGSMSATAADIARFMIAHLQNGRYGNSRILREDTAERMHTESFTHHPQLSGYAHGFEELKQNGQSALSHGGSCEGFQSFLMLLPEYNLGVFTSYNGTGGGPATDEMLRAFFERYFPAEGSPAPQPPAYSNPPAHQFSGWYKPVRSSATTIEKLLTLITAVKMTARDEHTLEFNGRRWAADGPWLYRDAGDRYIVGKDLMAFLPDEQGQIAYAAIGTDSYERIPWYETPDFTFAFLAGCMALALSGVIGWPVLLVLRRRKKGCQPVQFSIPLAARRVAALGSGLALVFFTGIGIALMGNTGTTSEFVYGVPPVWRWLLAVPIAIAALTAAALVLTPWVWKDRHWSLWERVHYTMVVAALAGLLWFMASWNLLGFHFG